MRKPDFKGKLRLGTLVFAVLVVIEVVEYFVGTMLQSGSWPFLGILALAGAWPILYYFMHIRQLKTPVVGPAYPGEAKGPGERAGRGKE